MTNKELLRAIIAEIDFIMHDKDYRFPESESTWYSRESCRVLTPEEVFEELRTELLQLNNETNREIAELQKQLEEKEKELKNSIRPKFKVGQEIWCIRFMEIVEFKINKIEIYRGESEKENRIVYCNWEDMVYQIEENCFATREEAEAKLKKLKV